MMQMGAGGLTKPKVNLVFIPRASLPLFACSCGGFFSSGGPKSVPQQSPKAQASVPQQSPKAQVSLPQQTPKAQAAEPRVQPIPAFSPDTSRKMLLGVDLAFSRACEERGAPEAFYEFMAPDGVCLLAGDAPVVGHDAIKVRFSAAPAESISWKPRESDISSNLELGYTWGTYELRTASPDKQSSANGKY